MVGDVAEVGVDMDPGLEGGGDIAQDII